MKATGAARRRVFGCILSVAIAGCGGTTAGGPGPDGGGAGGLDEGGATGTSGASGTSGGALGGPAARAFVYATMTPTTAGSCAGVTSLTTLLMIGTGVADENPTRVPSGGPIQIQCSVKSNGSTFAVSLSATSDSAVTGGSLTLAGSDISDTEGTDLTGAFLGIDTNGAYTASDCALTYETSEGAGGIAPGRIWGHIECAGATNASVTVDAQGTASTCDIAADFVFENCDG